MSHQIVNLSWVGLDLEYPLVFEVFPRCWAATQEALRLVS